MLTQLAQLTSSTGQPPATPVQQSQPNPYLIDGAAGTVLVVSLIGIIKMALPTFTGVFKSSQEAAIQAQKETRASELSIEAATAATMRSLLEQNAQASIKMNQDALETLTGHMSQTLDAVVVRLADLGNQMDKVSETQAAISNTQNEIATTQRRTLELIASIEDCVANHSQMSMQRQRSRPRRRLDVD
jgi:threonine synthase